MVLMKNEMAKRPYTVGDLLTAKAHLQCYVPYLEELVQEPHVTSLLNRVQNMIVWIDALDNYTDPETLDHANRLLDTLYEMETTQ